MKKVLGCQIVRQCFKNITMDFMYITKISKSTPEFFRKKNANRLARRNCRAGMNRCGASHFPDLDAQQSKVTLVSDSRGDETGVFQHFCFTKFLFWDGFFLVSRNLNFMRLPETNLWSKYGHALLGSCFSAKYRSFRPRFATRSAQWNEPLQLSRADRNTMNLGIKKKWTTNSMQMKLVQDAAPFLWLWIQKMILPSWKKLELIRPKASKSFVCGIYIMCGMSVIFVKALTLHSLVCKCQGLIKLEACEWANQRAWPDPSINFASLKSSWSPSPARAYFRRVILPHKKLGGLWWSLQW